jgi:hypothetical protein
MAGWSRCEKKRQTKTRAAAGKKRERKVTKGKVVVGAGGWSEGAVMAASTPGPWLLDEVSR